MRPGQAVRITARWSSFFGQRGTIDRIDGDAVFVLLEGERAPMRFEQVSFEPLVGAVSELNLTGAE